MREQGGKVNLTTLLRPGGKTKRGSECTVGWCLRLLSSVLLMRCLTVQAFVKAAPGNCWRTTETSRCIACCHGKSTCAAESRHVVVAWQPMLVFPACFGGGYFTTALNGCRIFFERVSADNSISKSTCKIFAASIIGLSKNRRCVKGEACLSVCPRAS